MLVDKRVCRSKLAFVKTSRTLRPLKRFALAALLLTLFSAGCKLDGLLYEPRTTPAEWCDLRPCVNIGGIVFNEPLGSFLVFLLAFLWVGAGGYFLKNHEAQRSRYWLGIALILGGLGAYQAGISYQAFSYQLKCAGREFCALTNGFEVGYSLTQAVSVSAMLTSVAIACTTGWFRRTIIAYCVLNAAVYVVITVIGVTQPSKFLLSFEVLMLFALPGILFVILVAGVQYARKRRPLDGALLGAALLLVVVNAAYFTYYGAGITAALYQKGRGFYFSENDVLHVGMILWLVYIVRIVGRHLRDFESEV